MQWTRVTIIGLILFVLLTIQAGDGSQVQASNRTNMADLLFTAVSFPQGTGHNFTLEAEGLIMGETAVYQSPILQAPIPFNAVVPQWTADLPDMELMIRTGTAVGQWQEWVRLHSHNDWDMPGDALSVGEMISVPAQDVTHQLIQFTIRAKIPGTVSQFRLTFIDSTNGPALDDMVARQTTFNTGQREIVTDGYPQPFVISRDAWCEDPACEYSEGLDYAPVTHLIVHHTKSDNVVPDWPAHLRAIWNYHTFGLGWGDIGYNYLVDPDGNIYEGHLGGDGVVGIHANAANSGSMGVAFMGDFEYITPADPMLDAAVELLAWKADQRDINVYESSDSLPNIEWGLPNLMGHRDVYGGFGTSCPGTVGHTLLPWLRDEVAARLGYVSSYVYVDELSSNFSKSNTSWFTAENQCGHNLHGYYTLSKLDPNQSYHWGEWDLPIVADGRYRVEVFIPYCDTGLWETAGANYEVHHVNGVTNVTINQHDNVGLWVSLGDYDLAANHENAIRLTNLTATDEELGIWFDDVRLLPLTATAVPITPTIDAWLGQPTVDFQWEINQPEDTVATRLEVATDPDFTDLLLDESWATAVLSHTHTFSQTYPNLYWRLRLDTIAGQSTSPASQFHLDLSPPQSSMTSIHWLPNRNRYILSWAGTDDASGLAAYNIEMRTAVTSTWQSLITNTLQTSLSFTPSTTDTVWFRSQAIDVVGNIEPPHLEPGDLNTTQAISLTHDIMLPIVKRN